MTHGHKRSNGNTILPHCYSSISNNGNYYLRKVSSQNKNLQEIINPKIFHIKGS